MGSVAIKVVSDPYIAINVYTRFAVPLKIVNELLLKTLPIVEKVPAYIPFVLVKLEVTEVGKLFD